MHQLHLRQVRKIGVFGLAHGIVQMVSRGLKSFDSRKIFCSTRLAQDICLLGYGFDGLM